MQLYSVVVNTYVCSGVNPKCSLLTCSLLSFKKFWCIPDCTILASNDTANIFIKITCDDEKLHFVLFGDPEPPVASIKRSMYYDPFTYTPRGILHRSMLVVATQSCWAGGRQLREVCVNLTFLTFSYWSTVQSHLSVFVLSACLFSTLSVNHEVYSVIYLLYSYSMGSSTVLPLQRNSPCFLTGAEPDVQPSELS